jgi:probable rRNA maturation factor
MKGSDRSSGPQVDVVIESDLWAGFPEAEELAAKAVAATARVAELVCIPDAELAIILADDARIRELNRDWRGKDKPTNVLSFPAAEGEEIETAPLLGDVIIAFETVAREAETEGKTIADHFTHLVVHGTLHLFGFDHEVEDEAEEMEDTERAVLASLGVADPYKETSPV